MPSLTIRVLVDNNTLIDRYYRGEPGLSFFIENGSRKVIFDTGYSGLFIENAWKMGLDPLLADYIVFSHGHIDHTGGLPDLARLFLEAKLESHRHRIPHLLAHPYCFYPRPLERYYDSGSLLSFDRVSQYFTVESSRAPVWITRDLVFLGEIERKIPLPVREKDQKRKILLPSGMVQDDLLDDSALACRLPDGIVIITGCSHSGIANIIEKAKQVCGDDRILDIIGGFHLLDFTPKEMADTVAYLKNASVRALHPCHCTSLAAKIAIAQAAPVLETGTGLTLSYGDESDQPIAE
jgi:7,8-dihydropterin-6-yl-methyl-4-(beta-D-ribofuranosyl)aminobenzene 5'-phosphate synthase